jgi:precorrin-4 methylase
LSRLGLAVAATALMAAAASSAAENETKVKHKGGSVVVADKSKPVRHALEAQYAKIAAAQKNEDIEALRATRTSGFTVAMPNGQTWDLETSLNYSKAGFEQVEKTEKLLNTIVQLDVHGDTAVAMVHQQWSRMQMKAGKLRHVATESVQTETWINTAAGWKLEHIGDIKPGVWIIDGKRVDPGKPYDPDAPPFEPEPTGQREAIAGDADSAKVATELAARYRENEAAFFARDPDRVMTLRHPDFHTITPDGKVNTREQMYDRTRSFINRVEKFDSLTEKITGLTLSGDTAHAVVDQHTVRRQRFPDGTLHEIRTSAVQRESWIKTTAGWLMWRVDHVQPGPTLVDGKPAPKN